jgi:glucose-1-phosphate thymidylyltransferase
MVYQQLLFYGNNYESILYCNISYYVLYILVDVLYCISSDVLISLLYFFDSNVAAYAAEIEPSPRGELEITDVLKKYLEAGTLKVEIISRGAAWLDTGTFDSLLAASNYVQVIEHRQGYKIGCPEEVAFLNKWISVENLENLIKKIGSNPYTDYLKSLTYTRTHEN